MTSDTSPTATETTGVSHASASFTTTGAPSRTDVITDHVGGVHRQRHLVARQAVEARGEDAGDARRSRSTIASKTSTRLLATFERSPRAAGRARRAWPAASPARAGPRPGRRAQTLEVDRARDHRRVANAQAVGDDRGDRDRLRPPRDQPRDLPLPRHPRVAAVEGRHHRRATAGRRPRRRGRSGRGRCRSGRAAAPGEAVAPPSGTGACAAAVERQHRDVDAQRRRSSTWSLTKQPKCGSAAVGYMFVSTSTRSRASAWGRRSSSVPRRSLRIGHARLRLHESRATVEAIARPPRSCARRRARAAPRSAASSPTGSRGRSPPSGGRSARARDVRRDDVAGAVVQVLAEGLRVARHHARVVDAHRLVAAVVVDDHLVRPDDGRPPQLAGGEPGQLDVGDRARGELAADEGHVLLPGIDAGAAHGDDRRRPLPEPVQEDREVVRREVPDARSRRTGACPGSPAASR